MLQFVYVFNILRYLTWLGCIVLQLLSMQVQTLITAAVSDASRAVLGIENAVILTGHAYNHLLESIVKMRDLGVEVDMSIFPEFDQMLQEA